MKGKSNFLNIIFTSMEMILLERKIWSVFSKKGIEFLKAVEQNIFCLFRKWIVSSSLWLSREAEATEYLQLSEQSKLHINIYILIRFSKGLKWDENLTIPSSLS